VTSRRFSKTRRDVVKALGAGVAVTTVTRSVFAIGGAELTGDLFPVHDPCIVKEGDTYHLFSTGQVHDATGLIPWRTSRDLVHWKLQGKVFESIPEWAARAVPGTGGLWAPDIAYFNGRFHLYYSVSTFGSNRSAIGLATNKTLDSSSKEFAWRDEGLVVSSSPGDDFNAIDANHVIDAEGNHWLSLGSFWSGLKLFPLDSNTGKLPRGDTRRYSIASRPAPEGAPGAIEAPFIIHRNGFYYLFASYDYCCRGANSSYYIVVGRAERIIGPYLGKDRKSMNDGYGSLLLRGNRRFRGPGHCAVLRDGQNDFLVYHAYDADHDGRPTLRIDRLEWRDQWPSISGDGG
jgi:arabinan endo-1,5-alpha-L-arabinosidase